jgi:hypothetical protein
MKKALGKLLLFSSSLLLTGGVIAHPHHPDSIHHQTAHSHSGIEYLVIFTILCLIGLIIAINRNK